MVGLTALVALALRVAPGELGETLERARPGDAIVLEAGTHRGRFEIEVPVRMTGEPGAVIEGTGEGTVLTLSADGIELEDLEIRGSGADLSNDDAVVLLLESKDIVIERCRIEARAFGIYIRGGGGHRVSENDLRGDPSIAANRRGNGIHLWHTEKNAIERNRLADVRDGIYLSFAHDNVISKNEGESLRYGIHYMYSEQNVLAGNRFTRCTGGIALMFSRGNRIQNNETHDNRDFGILCQQLERSVLEANRARGNGRALFIENSAGNEFIGNHLEGNGVGAYLTAGSEGNRFSQNAFVSNLVQVYGEHGGVNEWHADRRGNFWSDYVGLDWNGDGIGETPYRLQTAASALMARRPEARFLSMSPLLSFLEWWDAFAHVPVSDALDPFPLVESHEEGAR